MIKVKKFCCWVFQQHSSIPDTNNEVTKNNRCPFVLFSRDYSLVIVILGNKKFIQIRFLFDMIEESGCQLKTNQKMQKKKRMKMYPKIPKKHTQKKTPETKLKILLYFITNNLYVFQPFLDGNYIINCNLCFFS